MAICDDGVQQTRTLAQMPGYYLSGPMEENLVNGRVYAVFRGNLRNMPLIFSSSASDIIIYRKRTVFNIFFWRGRGDFFTKSYCPCKVYDSELRLYKSQLSMKACSNN